MPNSRRTPKSSVPPDNPKRNLSAINADSPEARHISIVGDTYTVLISGRDTRGRYCLIDMLVSTGGGPPPHRHDFEEMFGIVEGEIELTFRGEKVLAKAGKYAGIACAAYCECVEQHAPFVRQYNVTDFPGLRLAHGHRASIGVIIRCAECNKFAVPASGEKGATNNFSEIHRARIDLSVREIPDHWCVSAAVSYSKGQGGEGGKAPSRLIGHGLDMAIELSIKLLKLLAFVFSLSAAIRPYSIAVAPD